MNSNCAATSKTAAFYETGNPTVTVTNGGISVVGGFLKPQWSGTLSPTPVTGVPPQTFPEIVEPNCSLKSNFSNAPTM